MWNTLDADWVKHCMTMEVDETTGRNWGRHDWDGV